MPIRKLRFEPLDTFEFLPNESYRKAWDFLPNWDAKKIISQHLAHLKFHEWLRANLKVNTAAAGKPELWEPTVYHVAEGFFKSEILAYASVCELALYAVLKHAYDKDKSKLAKEALDCFECASPKFHNLGGAQVTTDLPDGQRVTSQIYIKYSKSEVLKDSERDFAMMISGAKAAGVIDAALEGRLDALRGWRNCVHLLKHIKFKEELGGEFVFDETDASEAKDCTEALRVAIDAYLKKA